MYIVYQIPMYLVKCSEENQVFCNSTVALISRYYIYNRQQAFLTVLSIHKMR